jgi:eukaryotic-like serine/threonine-protein kinase
LPDPQTRLSGALRARYALDGEIGAGGMATVYLARDLKHDRKVALKVLHPELSAVIGSERFLTEIRVTAGLQHPHILPLFDSGEADGLLFYVMPFVEGESLRARLERERQLPVAEAVRIASEVADALEYAHKRGLVHRDIKPENVLLHEGRALVADFGIALAVQQAGSAGRMTQTGLSLGTPQYMAPEQAMGERGVDARADVYALAAMTYEMLAGEPPFTGPSSPAILAKVLTERPRPLRVGRPSVPEHVEAAVERGLEKLPADRVQSALALAEALAGARPVSRAGGGAVTTGSPAFAEGTAGPWNRLSIANGAAAAILAVLLAGAVLLPRGDEQSRPVMRFALPLNEGSDLYLGGRDSRWGRPVTTSLAFSPDGTLLVYAGWQETAGDSTISRLYARHLGEERVEAIAGTEGASGPFFSPDGAWIGYFAGESLRRVPAVGGSPETLISDARLFSIGTGGFPRGASWGDDGTIVYAGAAGLYRVSGNGGEPALVAGPDTVAREFRSYTNPHVLPGSRVVLFTAMRTLDPDRAEILALELGSGTMTPVLTRAMDARYVETGHLLFLREGTLMAVGFDAGQVQVRGEPVIVQQGVMQAINMPNTGFTSGAGQVAVSPSGHLAFASGGLYPGRPRAIVLVPLRGTPGALPLDTLEYLYSRALPSGDRLATHVRTRRGGSDILVHDLARGVATRLETGGFSSGSPTWSPDGQFLAFRSDREDGVENIYRMRADGSGPPERLAPSRRVQTVSSWSSTGVIAYLEGGDIWTLPPDGEPALFFASAAEETHASFSPDGRWIAYASNQTGRGEVYVRPYPGPGPATQVSGNGGGSPVWSRDGKQIYYVQLRGEGFPVMMAVDVTGGEQIRPGRAIPINDPWPYPGSTPVTSHDVLPDGSFIAVLNVSRGADDATLTPSQRDRLLARVGEIHLVVNFLEELRGRRAP